MKIVSVVVSYNAYRAGFFPKCLEHLQKIDIDGFEHKIIVVDSASSDQTAERVKREFPEVKTSEVDIMKAKDFICDLCEYNDRTLSQNPCIGCCVLKGTDYFKLKTEIKEMIQKKEK